MLVFAFRMRRANPPYFIGTITAIILVWSQRRKECLGDNLDLISGGNLEGTLQGNVRCANGLAWGPAYLAEHSAHNLAWRLSTVAAARFRVVRSTWQ